MNTLETKKPLPTFNRETCTDAEWQAFFMAHHDYVISAAKTMRVTFTGPARLVNFDCPFCQERYITSTSERNAFCSSCLDNAKDFKYRCDKARAKPTMRRSIEIEQAIRDCLSGECDHDRGFCYRDYAMAMQGPGFFGE